MLQRGLDASQPTLGFPCCRAQLRARKKAADMRATRRFVALRASSGEEKVAAPPPGRRLAANRQDDDRSRAGSAQRFSRSSRQGIYAARSLAPGRRAERKQAPRH